MSNSCRKSQSPHHAPFVCSGGRSPIRIQKRVNGAILYSAVFSLKDRSSRVTLHLLADLFNPTPIRLLWEAFSYTAITARNQFIHINRPLSVQSQVFISSAEWTEATWNIRIILCLKWQQVNLNPRLRVQHSNHCATASYKDGWTGRSMDGNAYISLEHNICCLHPL